DVRKQRSCAPLHRGFVDAELARDRAHAPGLVQQRSDIHFSALLESYASSMIGPALRSAGRGAVPLHCTREMSYGRLRARGRRRCPTTGSTGSMGTATSAWPTGSTPPTTVRRS